MELCLKCGVKAATIYFIRERMGKEKEEAHLCEGCARPAIIRREASTQGPKKCEFCGGAAFSPLPGVRSITYACCPCRARYSNIFFELCSEQRPDVLARSKRDIFFFDMCFDPEVEHWADAAGHEAMQKLRGSGTQAC
ncbi:hypothetical protein SBV1_3460003 [Verrucomicrobia bacterium]|nr:hypothetical protein SBV1_3460003 [Verrucomicrobiota bacterium]